MLRIIDEDEFIEKCRQGRCLRQTFKSKQCEKDFKQIQCYKKYVDKKIKEYEKEHTEKDWEWEDLKRDLVLRDYTCLVMKILTVQELKIVEQQEGFWLSQKFIDGCHIVSRAQSPKNVYNRNNVILMSRFFHARIDNGFDLISGEYVGFEGSKRWWERIMRSNGYWENNYTYDMFYKDITEEK
jgi:hypothetical protein